MGRFGQSSMHNALTVFLPQTSQEGDKYTLLSRFLKNSLNCVGGTSANTNTLVGQRGGSHGKPWHPHPTHETNNQTSIFLEKRS